MTTTLHSVQCIRAVKTKMHTIHRCRKGGRGILPPPPLTFSEGALPPPPLFLTIITIIQFPWYCIINACLFLISQTSYHTYKIISSNELARPVMGTIFLVIGQAKRTPHWGVQSRFRVIYYICVSVICQITWNHVNQTRACSTSVLGGKIRPVTLLLFVSTIS